MPRASANQSATTTPVTIYNSANDGGLAKSISFVNYASSGAPLLVNIAGMHEASPASDGTTGWVPILPGTMQQFTFTAPNDRGSKFTTVQVRSASGTVTYGYGITFQ